MSERVPAGSLRLPPLAAPRLTNGPRPARGASEAFATLVARAAQAGDHGLLRSALAMGGGSASPALPPPVQGEGTGWGGAVPAAVPPAYRGLIAEAARRYGVEPALIAAVIETESGFNPRAGSPAGAKGLMQLMDATARGLGVSDPFDPRQNVLGGTRFLRQLLDRYGGDLRRALAAYNAGPGAVDHYGGIPPYAETQRYVPRVLAALARYRRQPAADWKE
jgi:soluble lytic murein transglycosylase-like protein